MTEDLETLGSYLKGERQKKEISLEQISYATRISVKMLSALEEDAHSILPAKPFVRGYLQAYAKYIDIDSKDVLLRYQQHLALNPAQSQQIAKANLALSKERHQEKRRMILVSVLLSCIILGSGAFFFLKKKMRENSKVATTQKKTKAIQNSLNKKIFTTALKPKAEKAKKSAETSAEPSTSNIKTTAKTETNKQSTKIEKPIAKTDTKKATKIEKKETVKAEKKPETTQIALTTSAIRKHNLRLEALNDVWFRFQLDNEEVKDIMLRKNKVIFLRANSIIKIFSGNLKGLQASYNGNMLDSLTTGNRTKSAIIPISKADSISLPLFPEQMAQDRLKEISKQENSSSNESSNSSTN